MIIKKLYIRAFGCIKDKEIVFSDRVNVISGNNETGKTTTAEFIRAMLYGFNSNVRNIRENPRNHYTPIDGDKAGGTIELEKDGRIYIISRTFGKTKAGDKLTVSDGVSGAELDILPEEIVGMDCETFCKTHYIKQMSVKISGTNDDEVQKKLMNLAQTGDEEASYQNARNILSSALKELTAKGKGIIPGLNDEIAAFQTERAKSLQAAELREKYEDEIKSKTKEIERLKEQLGKTSREGEFREKYAEWTGLRTAERERAEKEQRLKAQKESEERAKTQRSLNILLIAAVIFALISLSAFAFLPMTAALIPAVICLFLYICKKKSIDVSGNMGKEDTQDACNKSDNDVKYIGWFKSELGAESYDDVPGKLEQYINNYDRDHQRRTEQLLELGGQIRDIENAGTNLSVRPTAAIDQDILMRRNRIKAYQQKVDSIEQAISALDGAFRELEQNYAPALNKEASEVLSCITDGMYTSVFADNIYSLAAAQKDGAPVDAEYFSTGLYDQIYFALRMSIIKLLDSDAPLILDDAFAFYDDNRLKKAMEFINSNTNNQIILFSCHGREQNAL